MDWLLNKFSAFINKNAILYKGKCYTYSELELQVKKYYLELNRSISSGEVVVILSGYTFYSIAFFLALIKNKNIIVPITSQVDHEITERIESCNADKKIIFHGSSFEIMQVSCKELKHNYIEQLITTKNAGLILFSSGSSGKPKAMAHNLDAFIDSFQNRKQKNLKFLVFLMFDHIGGLNTLFNCLSMGATITLPESRDAEHICSLIEKNSIDILPASPTFLNLILISEAYKNYNLSSLKMITYGTEPMPESLLLRLKGLFPKAKLLQTFGTSETGIAQISSKSSTSLFMKIDDPNLEYKIVENELWLRSKTQILGYLNSSMERFTNDGWFQTGDLVETNEDGFIKIIGRNSEVINVGGQKVLPVEIESVILQMPQIVDCMVFGEKNAITGMSVVAEIVIKNEQINNLEIKKNIRFFCRGKLDDYKIPTKVIIVEKTNINDRFKKIRRKDNE